MEARVNLRVVNPERHLLLQLMGGSGDARRPLQLEEAAANCNGNGMSTVARAQFVHDVP